MFYLLNIYNFFVLHNKFYFVSMCPFLTLFWMEYQNCQKKNDIDLLTDVKKYSINFIAITLLRGQNSIIDIKSCPWDQSMRFLVLKIWRDRKKLKKTIFLRGLTLCLRQNADINKVSADNANCFCLFGNYINVKIFKHKNKILP